MLGTLVPHRIDMSGKTFRVIRVGDRTNGDGKAVGGRYAMQVVRGIQSV